MSRRGEKGKEIQYKEIEMAEYLLPNNSLNIENKRTIFSIRNRMVQISANFSSQEKNISKCWCGENIDMLHIYECKYFEVKEPIETYEKIFYGTIFQQITVFDRFKKNFEKYEKYSNTEEIENGTTDQRNPDCVPLSSVLLDYSNG